MITGITYKNDTTTIRYESENDVTGGIDKYVMKSDEAPRQELKDALSNLAPIALTIIGMDASYLNSLVITGVKIKKKGDVKFYSISAVKHLIDNRASFTFTTPPKPNVSEEEEFALNGEAIQELMRLEAEAERYRTGQRLQAELDFEDEDEDEDEED